MVTVSVSMAADKPRLSVFVWSNNPDLTVNGGPSAFVLLHDTDSSVQIKAA
jgi:hypothetical protein